MEDTDLAFAGLARQADLIQAGEVSSRELTELYLRRIEAIDPRINAFRIVLAELALAEAAQADARRRSGDTRGGGDRRPRRAPSGRSRSYHRRAPTLPLPTPAGPARRLRDRGWRLAPRRA